MLRVDHPPGRVLRDSMPGASNTNRCSLRRRPLDLVLTDIDEANVVGKHVGDEVVRSCAVHERLAAPGQAPSDLCVRYRCVR